VNVVGRHERKAELPRQPDELSPAGPHCAISILSSFSSKTVCEGISNAKPPILNDRLDHRPFCGRFRDGVFPEIRRVSYLGHSRRRGSGFGCGAAVSFP
jgi:hypothetical protein